MKANDDDSDDDEFDEAEETALESYETPLDKDDCPIDEYQIFKSLIQCKFILNLLDQETIYTWMLKPSTLMV